MWYVFTNPEYIVWYPDVMTSDVMINWHHSIAQCSSIGYLTSYQRYDIASVCQFICFVSSWLTSAACMVASLIMTGMSKRRCLVSSPLKTLVREISGSAFVTGATWNQTEVFSSAQNISMKSLCDEMTSSPVWLRSWTQYNPPGFMMKNHRANLH